MSKSIQYQITITEEYYKLKYKGWSQLSIKEKKQLQSIEIEVIDAFLKKQPQTKEVGFFNLKNVPIGITITPIKQKKLEADTSSS